MGIFSFLSKNKLTNVEAHILDPMRGYYVETWVVGEDIEREAVKEYATSSGELYVLYAYEDGEPQIMVAKKEIWEKQKSIFTSIDQGNDFQEDVDEIINDLQDKIDSK